MSKVYDVIVLGAGPAGRSVRRKKPSFNTGY